MSICRADHGVAEDGNGLHKRVLKHALGSYGDRPRLADRAEIAALKKLIWRIAPPQVEQSRSNATR